MDRFGLVDFVDFRSMGGIADSMLCMRFGISVDTSGAIYVEGRKLRQPLSASTMAFATAPVLLWEHRATQY